MKKVYLSIVSFLAVFAVNAQESENPFTLSGYVDTYYFANLNGVSGPGANLGASGFERIFDHNANSFQVGLAQMMTTYENGDLTAVIDLTFGNHADLGNYVWVAGSSTGMAIKQAYLSYAMTDALSLTAGTFGTNVGYEVIDAPANFNYSLSNLFGNGPFYHTGIKLDYAASDKLGFMVGINNGLDSKDDFNKSKGFMAQIYTAPTDGWDLYLNYYSSDEGLGDDTEKYQWLDITTSYQVTDNFLVGLNAVPFGSLDNGVDTKKWWGAALYLNGNVSEKLGLGLRAERFDNSEGGMYLLDTNGDGTAVTSLTATVSVDLTDHLMFKPEVRFDSYTPTSGYQLIDDTGAFTKNSQTTIGAALIAHF